MFEEFIGETKSNIKTLFKSDDEIKDRIDKLEDGQKQLDKITYILESQQELNEKQTNTLSNINENLIKLNSTVNTLESSVGDLSSRVVSLEETGKFDFSKFSREFFYKVLPTALGTLLVAWLLWKFGIK